MSFSKIFSLFQQDFLGNFFLQLHSEIVFEILLRIPEEVALGVLRRIHSENPRGNPQKSELYWGFSWITIPVPFSASSATIFSDIFWEILSGIPPWISPRILPKISPAIFAWNYFKSSPRSFSWICSNEYFKEFFFLRYSPRHSSRTPQ